MSVTISDVAREAGVSTTSVCYILRDDRRYRYRPETVRRVREAAARIGYQANSAARLLREQTKRLVGVAVSMEMRPPMNHFASAVHKELIGRGLQPVLFEPCQEFNGRALPFLSPELLAGIISTDLGMEETVHDFYESLLGKLPIIALYPVQDKRVDVVSTDRIGQFDVAVRHLVELGHRKIAFAGNFSPVRYSDIVKLEGWRKAVLQHDLDPSPEFDIDCGVMHPDDIPEVGARLGRHLAKLKKQPTALICVGDSLALSMVSQLAGLGRRVPRDLSVVAFESNGCAALCWPPLTSVIPRYDEIARRAVDTMLQRARERATCTESGACRSLVLPSLIVRASTAAPRRDARDE